MGMSDDIDGSWEQYSKLVLNEIGNLKTRIDALEQQIENKLDRTLDSFKEDHKQLEQQVNQMVVDMAVIKKEMEIKSIFISTCISGFITIAGIILAALFT